jgi:hypothetical protein
MPPAHQRSPPAGPPPPRAGTAAASTSSSRRGLRRLLLGARRGYACGGWRPDAEGRDAPSPLAPSSSPRQRPCLPVVVASPSPPAGRGGPPRPAHALLVLALAPRLPARCSCDMLPPPSPANVVASSLRSRPPPPCGLPPLAPAAPGGPHLGARTEDTRRIQAELLFCGSVRTKWLQRVHFAGLQLRISLGSSSRVEGKHLFRWAPLGTARGVRARALPERLSIGHVNNRFYNNSLSYEPVQQI